MDIKLDFDAAEVAAKLHDAIASSAFKEIFTKAVQKHIEEITKSNGWSGGYQTVVDNVIKSFVTEQMRSILDTEYKDRIREKILDKFISGKIDELADKFIDRISLSNY